MELSWIGGGLCAALQRPLLSLLEFNRTTRGGAAVCVCPHRACNNIRANPCDCVSVPALSQVVSCCSL